MPNDEYIRRIKVPEELQVGLNDVSDPVETRKREIEEAIHAMNTQEPNWDQSCCQGPVPQDLGPEGPDGHQCDMDPTEPSVDLAKFLNEVQDQFDQKAEEGDTEAIAQLFESIAVCLRAILEFRHGVLIQ